jgi:hypothetical protein
MAYIGRDTDKISNVEVLDNITFDGSSSYTLQKGGSNFTPSSANTLLLSIDGVVQAGNFTVSGSTIDFGTAVAGTSTCDFVLHYGVGLITAPSDGTVTTAKLADSSVTTAKLNDASVSLAKLTATGTKDATTFLRGDNTFAEAGGGKVLQVVTATDGTERTTTSSSFVTASNTLSLNITPSSTSNKILLIMSSTGQGGSGSGGFYTIFKDGSNLGNASNGFTITDIGTLSGIAINYLDSPSTTSEITYDVRFRIGISGQTAVLQKQNCTASLTAIEVSA